jgi:hypothetical protein
MDKRQARSFVMVRTTCCETVRQTGVRCSVCPHRVENVPDAREFERILRCPAGRQMQVSCTAPEPGIAAG